MQFTLHCWLQSELNEHFDRFGWLNSSWPAWNSYCCLCNFVIAFSLCMKMLKSWAKRRLQKKSQNLWKNWLLVSPYYKQNLEVTQIVSCTMSTVRGLHSLPVYIVHNLGWVLVWEHYFSAWEHYFSASHINRPLRMISDYWVELNLI